ncbi:MAG: radical SAM protein [Sulfolobales archaeon]
MCGVYTNFRNLWIWKYLGRRVSWYLKVSINEMPAKYLIAKRTPTPLDKNSEISVEEGLKIYEKATEEFLRIKRDVENGLKLGSLEIPSYSLLDLAKDLVWKIVRKCVFCRWRCGVDRSNESRLGACMLTTESRVSSYFHHLGEELIFRGTHGSGTIFFTSCNMRCLFCQNADISKDRFNGIPVTPRQLAQMAYMLRIEGCHNINWVGGEPTPHIHSIVTAIWHLAYEGFRLRPSEEDLDVILRVKHDFFLYPYDIRYAYYEGEFNVPMLFNTNMFLSREALIILRPLIDIWLPDLKYGPGRCSIRLSRTPWYWETATENLKILYEWGEDIVIRHLIMPNHVECCSKPVIDWISKNIPETPVNLMDQYRPEYQADPRSPLFNKDAFDIARRPTREELEEVWRYAEERGIIFREITFEKKGYRPEDF